MIFCDNGLSLLNSCKRLKFFIILFFSEFHFVCLKIDITFASQIHLVYVCNDRLIVMLFHTVVSVRTIGIRGMTDKLGT